MTLAEAFSIGEREVISLVGGGREDHPSVRPGQGTLGASLRGHPDYNDKNF